MKKVVLGLILPIMAVTLLAGCSSPTDSTETSSEDVTSGAVEEVAEADEVEDTAESNDEVEEVEDVDLDADDSEEVDDEDASVSREHRNALRSAENYLRMMPFSKAGLFEQLTSSYGDDYPEEAAQYAVDNVDTDWNANALKAAENYLDLMPMSDSELYDQLVSEYGDKYTPEQAQYAIDNLDD